MRRLNNQDLFTNLREDYPFFCYEEYTIQKTGTQLILGFHFNLSDKYYFNPKMIFPIFNPISDKELSEIKTLVFHIGMIELISYWKTSCSPKLIIKPHLLKPAQIDWWKKLFFHGLGEFFHINGIKTNQDTFMDIEADSGLKLPDMKLKLNEEILLPIGGGKDSAVSIELLKHSTFNITPYQINSNPSRNNTIENAGFSLSESMEVKRKIHPQLLALNEAGFLNGHTPFSALLAFSGLLAAYLNKSKYIALSNESSASEATIPGTKINHQYSKSIEFESYFREYVKKFISPEFNYFSFLRPLNELQIAKLFASFDHHHKDFRSCNVGSKENKWCGKCPKCLFTYIILDPFLEEEKLRSIFGKDLLDDDEMLVIFEELCGISKMKPFECVGSIDDVNIALHLSLQKRQGKKLAFLLKHYQSAMHYPKPSKEKIYKYLNTLYKTHFLTDRFLQILTQQLDDSRTK